jgi:hypothetical protein
MNAHFMNGSAYGFTITKISVLSVNRGALDRIRRKRTIGLESWWGKSDLSESIASKIAGFSRTQQWPDFDRAANISATDSNSRATIGNSGRFNTSTGTPRSRATSSFGSVAALPLFLLISTSIC